MALTKASFTIMLTSNPTISPCYLKESDLRSLDRAVTVMVWQCSNYYGLFGYLIHDLHHQRNETLLQESFQVKETCTISGFKSWAWASIDIDTHNKHH
jgi:hypothetical protein